MPEAARSTYRRVWSRPLRHSTIQTDTSCGPDTGYHPGRVRQACIPPRYKRQTSTSRSSRTACRRTARQPECTGRRTVPTRKHHHWRKDCPSPAPPLGCTRRPRTDWTRTSSLLSRVGHRRLRAWRRRPRRRKHEWTRTPCLQRKSIGRFHPRTGSQRRPGYLARRYRKLA